MDLTKELIAYVFFGVLTTIVNFITYFLFEGVFGINYLISNIIAWFVSVLFAYITNRIWVFESKDDNIIKEILLFYGGRSGYNFKLCIQQISRIQIKKLIFQFFVFK